MEKRIRGLFLIDKPKGITSFEVIHRLRRVTHEKTIGHAGTLDPLASGLLLVAVGREYTSKLKELIGLDKEYEAEIEIGKTSPTYDLESTPVSMPHQQPSLKDVEQALESLEGNYEQMPPIHSAKKVNGERAYEIARRGDSVELNPKLITVYKIGLLDYNYPIIKILVKVSSGTYIRSLARDLGEKLLTGSYLLALKRTQIGQYDLSKAKNSDELNTVEDLEQCKVL